MQDFNSLFPTFLTTCTQLKTTLMPVAYLLIVVGVISSTITGHRSAGAYMRTFGRSIVYIMLLTYLVTWGNQMTQIVDTTVKEVIKADPANVFDEYKAALIAKKSTSEQSGWWDKISHASASLFEAIVSGFLWLIGLIASAIVFIAYIVQKMALYLGYSIAPIFIGFMAIRGLSDLGNRYILGLVGIMAWPLGWAVSAIVTDGLLTFMTDQSFLSTGAVVGTVNYGFQNFIGLAVLGVWVIFSTIASPVIIQHTLQTGYQAATALLSGAAGAGLSGVNTGVNTAANLSSRGGNALVTGALAGVAGAAAATTTLASTSLNGRFPGSMVNQLSALNTRPSSNGGQKQRQANQFADDDKTGSKAAKDLISQSRNSQSGQT